MPLRAFSVLVVTLGLALACGGDVNVEPVNVDVVAPVPVVAPSVAPTQGPNPNIAVPAYTGEVDEAVVAAYAADCARVFPTDLEPDMGEGIHGDINNECTGRMMQQNCSPDAHGCWDKSEECRNGCGAPCATCQDQCTTGCNDCKSACNNDSACVQACAVTRAQCRQTCLMGLAACEGDGCGQVEKACLDAASVMVAQTCGACEPLTACVLKAWEKEDYELKSCKTEMPAVKDECWGWCNPMMMQ